MSNTREHEGSVPYQSRAEILVPTQNGEKRYGIRTIDWERCKRKIRSSEIPSRRNSIIWSALLGFCASNIMNYISIYESSNISPFVKALSICVIFFSALGSIVFYLQDEENRKSYNLSIKEILTDMSDIEGTFPNRAR